ncbi:DUF4748 domain-containing protein [Anguilla anguilla]|uniref:Uncharacterized protein n=1 Tax=Anguilla anguilla TaxID=7936 RepID=A0A0E9XTF2_ANGAN|nr:DUF4748 domain-containing protein [Anguilla anguilla]KAG5852459.1 hypothetical protein ANANG_G00062620 [Anguilla anguilla]
MAAPCRELLRSVAVSGLRQIASGFSCIGQSAALKASNFGSHLKSSTNRRVHCSHGTALMCVKPEPHRTTEEVDQEQPDYIPRKKAKNPMMKIGYAWMIGLPSGIIGFILAKREVDKNRLKQLKIRQRMKRANEGVYESERYKLHQKVE